MEAAGLMLSVPIPSRATRRPRRFERRHIPHIPGSFFAASRTSCDCLVESPHWCYYLLNSDLDNMINRPPTPPDTNHYPEPEIIPPGQTDGRAQDNGRWTRVFVDERGTHRIYVTRIGPLGLLPFALLFGFVSVALFVFFIGAFVILIPLLGLVAAAAIIASLLRASSRRLH
jgi:hypothetical protein